MGVGRGVPAKPPEPPLDPPLASQLGLFCLSKYLFSSFLLRKVEICISLVMQLMDSPGMLFIDNQFLKSVNGDTI